MANRNKKSKLTEGRFASIANANKMYVKLGWCGGKTLYDAVARYNEAVEEFRKANNLSMAKVNELLTKPENLLDTSFDKASTGRILEAFDAGRAGKFELVGTSGILVQNAVRTIAKKGK